MARMQVVCGPQSYEASEEAVAMAAKLTTDESGGICFMVLDGRGPAAMVLGAYATTAEAHAAARQIRGACVRAGKVRS